MKRCGLFVGAVLCVLSAPARADERTEAKNFFKAGAAAYEAGDYLAAIQALDAAYRLTPLPAIAFSLAQAERRQYFVSREPGHLTRAIELYRTYLKEVPNGGRRADATDALAQLEPLAVSVAAPVAAETAPPAPKETQKTRLMVSSETPRAAITLDGAKPVRSPLIAEVTPGEHVVRVSAPGFHPAERRAVAIPGEFVPVEVELTERPAVVIVRPSSEADLYVDGSYFGKVHNGTRIEVAAGEHQFAFARPGRHLASTMLTVERGSTTQLPVELHWTGQRMTAVSMFVVSSVTLLGGLTLTGFAVERQVQAELILEDGKSRPLTEAERDDYNDAIEQRDRLAVSAGTSLAVSFASLVTGFLLYQLDEPNVREGVQRPQNAPSKPAIRVEGAVAPTRRGVEVGARITW